MGSNYCALPFDNSSFLYQMHILSSGAGYMLPGKFIRRHIQIDVINIVN